MVADVVAEQVTAGFQNPAVDGVCRVRQRASLQTFQAEGVQIHRFGLVIHRLFASDEQSRDRQLFDITPHSPFIARQNVGQIRLLGLHNELAFELIRDDIWQRSSFRLRSRRVEHDQRKHSCTVRQFRQCQSPLETLAIKVERLL